MGKIIKTILATEDNDPMGLLGSYGVFTPKRFSSKKTVKKKPKDEKLNKKNKVKKLQKSEKNPY